MQIAGSHTGISRAMFRFSHLVVPVGHVPSTGKADTGSESPLLAIITAWTLRTMSGALSLTVGGRLVLEVTLPGTFTSWRLASVSSTAWKFRLTISSPFLP